MRKAYWTTNNGEIVTAHRNRHGSEVNFKLPSRKLLAKVASGYKIVLTPANGVWTENLELATEVRRIVVRQNDEKTHNLVDYDAVTIYQGVEVLIPIKTQWEPIDDEKAALARAALLREEKERIEKRTRQEAHYEELARGIRAHIADREGKDLLFLLGITDFRSLAMTTDYGKVDKILSELRRVENRRLVNSDAELDSVAYVTVVELQKSNNMNPSQGAYQTLIDGAREALAEQRATNKESWASRKATGASR